jgi:hypothetical protein
MSGQRGCPEVPLLLAANYFAFIKLASIRVWLRAYESTP